MNLDITNVIKNEFKIKLIWSSDEIKQKYIENVRASIEEKWALFLLKFEDGLINEGEV